jgi:hypothetical protein
VQRISGGKSPLTPQNPGLPPGSIGIKRRQPCRGLAVLGHQDAFAGRGGVDESGELGFGLVSVLWTRLLELFRTDGPPWSAWAAQDPAAARRDDVPEQPEPPSAMARTRCWRGLDHLGVLQGHGGITLTLIALFSSDAPISVFGRALRLQQQWGIPFIVASLASVVVVAAGCDDLLRSGAPLAPGSR